MSEQSNHGVTAENKARVLIAIWMCGGYVRTDILLLQLLPGLIDSRQGRINEVRIIQELERDGLVVLSDGWYGSPMDESSVSLAE